MSGRCVASIARWTAADGSLSASAQASGGTDRFGRMLAHVVSTLAPSSDAAWIVATTLGPIAADRDATAPTAGSVARAVADARGSRAEVDVINAGPASVAMALVDLGTRPASDAVLVAFVDVATERYDAAAVAFVFGPDRAQTPLRLGRPVRRELDDAWPLDGGLAAHPLAPALALADRLRARTPGWLACESVAAADGRRW